MTLFVDSTALLGRWIGGPWRATVAAAMAADDEWAASALALTEALAVAERLDDPGSTRRLRRLLRDDWDRYWVVPVDQAVLDRAADLARDHPLRTVDALHLAAAARLPAPLTYLTFEPNQIPVAIALGFDVVSTVATDPGTGTAARTPTGRHPDAMAWEP